MLKRVISTIMLAASVSACTVNVNSPDNTAAPSASPSETTETSPAPSTSPTPTASPELEIPTAGLIESFDFAEAPPTDTARAEGVSLTTDRLGQANQAWNFNGANSFFLVDRDINGEALPQVTLSAWVRSTNASPENTGHIISHDNANTSRILALFAEDVQGFAAATGPAPAKTQVAPAQVNTWQLLTVSYDDAAGEVAFYVNGQLIEKSTDLAPRGGYDYFYVGASPFSGKYFEGDIDEVRVYNRVLSSEEVQRLYTVSKDK